MEQVISQIEDVVPEELIHKLSNTASFGETRRPAEFSASGASTYSVGSSNLIRIPINGVEYLDPSTVLVQFTINNAETVPNAALLLRNLGSPNLFFSRVTLEMAGKVVHNIDNYPRFCTTQQALNSKASNVDLDSKAFGRRFDMDKFRDQGNTYTALNYSGIPGGQGMVVTMKLFLGMFDQKKYLNLKFCPMVLTLYLCANATDPIIDAVAPFSGADTSILWNITNPKVTCDLVTLSSELDNFYSETLLGYTDKDGVKHEPAMFRIEYTDHHTISSVVPPATYDHTFNVHRSISKLNKILCTLEGPRTVDNGALCAPVAGKYGFDLWSPMMNYANTSGDDRNALGEIEAFEVIIGSRRWPSGREIQSYSQAMSELQKAVGYKSNAVHGMDISRKEYHNNKFIAGFNTQVLSENSLTGISLQNGLPVSVRIKHNQMTNNNMAKVHVTLENSQIIEIMSTGINVLV